MKKKNKKWAFGNDGVKEFEVCFMSVDPPFLKKSYCENEGSK